MGTTNVLASYAVTSVTGGSDSLGLVTVRIQQAEDAISRVVVADTDVLKNLLTTRQFYLASTANPASYAGAVLWTGQPYNTTQAIADARPSRWVTLPSTERAGMTGLITR